MQPYFVYGAALYCAPRFKLTQLAPTLVSKTPHPQDAGKVAGQGVRRHRRYREYMSQSLHQFSPLSPGAPAAPALQPAGPAARR